MKRMLKLLTMLALVLALVLPQGVFAEETDLLQEIFTALTAEGSDYSEGKAVNLEYYPEMQYEEVLGEDSITITVTGNEYMEGSWSFVKDGDYLTLTVGSGDYGGIGLTVYLLKAVGNVYGMNGALLNAYISGLNALGMDSPYFVMEYDEAQMTTTYKIYIAGPFDMKELDEMVLTEDVLNLYGYDPLTENEYTSRSVALGKIYMMVNGNKSGVTMLVAEYGELDDLAYQGMINVVKALQPDGWEAFTAEYTELTNADTEIYNVVLNADDAAVLEIMDEILPEYAYGIVHIGTDGAYEEDYDAEGYVADGAEIDETYNGTYWESEDGLLLEAVWQDGYYKIAIMNGETEYSYLCDQGKVSGYLFSLGTGIAEEDDQQPDYGWGIFYSVEEGSLLWEQADGTCVMFTRVAEAE